MKNKNVFSPPRSAVEPGRPAAARALPDQRGAKVRAALIAWIVWMCTWCAPADVLTGTWNLRWFPSGRAEHRASPRVEQANVLDAAEVIRTGLSRRRPGDAAILFFQELRNETACSNLVAAIGVTNLAVAGVSAFRDYDRRLGWQQTAIVTDLPVLDAGFTYWRRMKGILPPRGFTYAVLDAGTEGAIACYGVHLKSNYRARSQQLREQNRLKREASVRQLLAHVKALRDVLGRPVTRVVIAGDFNTDPYSGQFQDEKTLSLLTEASFENVFDGAEPNERATHPGSKSYPDSTLDFVFYRGFSARIARWLSPAVPLSDHRMVWLLLK